MYDVIIIGSGPAGLTAAIYTTRANFKTLVIAGSKWGGQLMLTTLVENFPGFPEGIQGPDLMMAMRKQAEHHGSEIIEKDFVSGDFTSSPFKITTAEVTYETKAVILATGADTKWLGVKGEQEKIGRGVSSCAPCDGPFFKNKNIIVVGGGDSAMEEALVLSNFASSVTLVHRREEFRASQIMQDKVKKNPKISLLFNKTVEEILGDQVVSGVSLRDTKTGEITTMDIGGVFVAVGHIPNTSVFKAMPAGRQGIDVDEKGFIRVHDHFKTNIEGVFVAGDVHDNEYKQAITAAGFGCAAALETEKWLREKE